VFLAGYVASGSSIRIRSGPLAFGRTDSFDLRLTRTLDAATGGDMAVRADIETPFTNLFTVANDSCKLCLLINRILDREQETLVNNGT
jgi:hypothetical protein